MSPRQQLLVLGLNLLAVAGVSYFVLSTVCVLVVGP